MRKLFSTIAIALLAVASQTTSASASGITITPKGNNVFVLQGPNVNLPKLLVQLIPRNPPVAGKPRFSILISRITDDAPCSGI